MSKENGTANGHSPGVSFETQDKSEVDRLTEADVAEGEEPPRGAGNLFSTDMTMGRIKEEDHQAMRFLFKNQHEFSESERPPQGSMIQGAVRAAFHGDPRDRATAMAPDERTDEHSQRLMAEFRTSRSVDGFQQEKLVEQRQVQVMDDQRGDEQGTEDSGGLLSIFS